MREVLLLRVAFCCVSALVLALALRKPFGAVGRLRVTFTLLALGLIWLMRELDVAENLPLAHIGLIVAPQLLIAYGVAAMGVREPLTLEPDGSP